MHPPSPDSEKGAGQGAPNFAILTIPTAPEYADETLVRQARRIQRIFFFRPDTARTIAAHAYRVRP